MFKKLLLAFVLCLTASGATPQGNPQCPTRPYGDTTNACASTAFVHNSLSNIPAAKIFRLASGTYTPSITATQIEIWLQGPGGGGSGNNASNTIPYSQYGRIGGPSAFGELLYTVTGVNTGTEELTAVGSNLSCNQPLKFTSTGTLPSPLVVGTVYYVNCASPAPTANTFAVSTVQYQIPLTCGVYATFCQTPVNLTTSGSGTITVHAYRYVAQSGSGGGGRGDEAVPGSYVGCDSNGPAGYVQSYGLQGGVGNNVNGMAISAGAGGNGVYGGAGQAGEAGSNGTGAGGSGAYPTTTSSGGGGGGSGGFCYIILKPSGSYPILCGLGGSGGVGGSIAVSSITIASPGVVSFAAATNFGPNAVIRFTNATGLPTGLLINTDYYIYGPSISDSGPFSFSVSATPNGTPINTTGAFSGSHNVTSGTLNPSGVGYGNGGDGGHGQCVIKESYGAL